MAEWWEIEADSENKPPRLFVAAVLAQQFRHGLMAIILRQT